MSITYNWTISTLDAAPSQNGLSNVVKTIHWRYRATEDTYSTETYGAANLGAPDAEHFTPFNELTKEQVEDWLNNELDVPVMQTQLQNAIEQMKNPPIVHLAAPWNVSANV